MGKKRAQRASRQQEVKQAGTRELAASSQQPLMTLLILVLCVAALSYMTVMRNRVYLTTVSLWKSIVDSAPDKRRSHENYGQALSTEGSLSRDPERATRLYQDALQEFRTVLSLPDDGSVPLRDVYREIGVVYFRLGMIDESIGAWKEGLKYAPYDPGLLNNISIAFMRQNRLDEALAYAVTAKDGNPTMPEPANSLGEILMARGEYAKAAEQFMRFVLLRPEDPRGYWNAALALEKSGLHQRAYEMAGQYLAREGNPQLRAMAMSFMNSIKGKEGRK